MGDPINGGGASPVSHSQTAGTENQKPITDTVTVNGKPYNVGKAKVWGLRIAREVLGVHGLVKSAYNHFQGKLHDHRADGNVAGTSKPPSTPLMERAARPLPELPNKLSESPDTTGSKPSFTPPEIIDSAPETPQPAKPLTVPEIISDLTFGGFEGDDGFSLSKFSDTVQQLPTSDIKTLLVDHNDKLLAENIRQEVREIYAERKVTEALGPSFDGDVQGLKDKFAKRYTSSPKLAKAVNTEINRQLNIQQGPDPRSPELQQLTPGLQGIYSSDNGAKLGLSQEFPKAPDNPAINKQFSEIEGRSPVIKNRIDNNQAFKDQAFPKFTNIHLGKADQAFAPGAPYHAARVDLPGGSFIAGQGPLENTETNFVKLLAHHRPAVSISLVNSEELKDPSISGRKSTKRSIEIGPKVVGEEKDYGGVKVKLDGQYSFDEGRVTVKQLSVNGETQFRVYDKGWEDHSAGNPERLAKLSVLVEKLREHPSVAARSDNPTVVNCNAGVGRTGTFVTINNSLREYQKTGQPPQDYTQTITTARQVRNKFVQTPGQLNTVAAVHGQFTPLFDPLLKEAGLTVSTPVQTPVTPQEAPEPEDNGLNYGADDYATINRDERDAGRIRRASQDDTYVNTRVERDTSIEEVSEEEDTVEPPPILTPSPAPEDTSSVNQTSQQLELLNQLIADAEQARKPTADRIKQKVFEGKYDTTDQNGQPDINYEALRFDLVKLSRRKQDGQQQLEKAIGYIQEFKAEGGKLAEAASKVEAFANDLIIPNMQNQAGYYNRPTGQVGSN
ncbi:MAG: tyrosine-protein phosphatase [Endozoicomonas sp.]|uniref:tyrosine-protein phosphatase n=1 Tax=Endozoicomonas sp. TaxID=1892382 RepID=UPI003D9B3E12